MDDPTVVAPEAQEQNAGMPDESMGQSIDGFAIEILVMPGDQFQVSVERPNEEAPSEPQQFSSLKDMLTGVMEMIRNKGQAADPMGGDMPSEKDAFKAGFNDGVSMDKAAY